MFTDFGLMNPVIPHYNSKKRALSGQSGSVVVIEHWHSSKKVSIIGSGLVHMMNMNACLSLF